MKNKRNMIGVVAAVLLALVGGLLLLQSSNESSSEATEEPVETAQVLVAARDIDRGTTASDLSENAFAFVVIKSVPADQVQADALRSTDDLSELALGGNVLVRPIQDGVQLRLSDFIVPGQQATTAVEAPANLFEITLVLDAQRALTDKLRAGQEVAVVGSFDPQGDEPSETVVILDSVFVVDAEADSQLSEAQLASDPLAPSLAFTGQVTVTLAVPVEDLERLTYAAEFGRIWLARQGDAATTDGSEVRDRDSVVVAQGGSGAAVSFDNGEGEDGAN